MTAPRVSVLTPAGSGAIATVAVVGRGAWEAARRLFSPAGRTPLPDAPPLHRFWFGTFGDAAGAGDEVVLAVRRVDPEPRIEVHCHGGRRVVRWVVQQFVECGCAEGEGQESGDRRPWASEAAELLPRAPTVRTASILLDQYRGALDRAFGEILAHLETRDLPGATRRLSDLARLVPVGRHLVEPWRVVLAGPPNVGKSSLLNALAGYRRSVVSAAAGTTRDVVTVAAAFDGWPVELADTAGLRRAAEALEAAGIERAARHLSGADLVVWLLDAAGRSPVLPDDGSVEGVALPMDRLLVVANKADAACGAEWLDADRFPRVSATTGAGVADLISAVVGRLVPFPPTAGAAVPFAPELAGAIGGALRAVEGGNASEAAALLRAVLAPV